MASSQSLATDGGAQLGASAVAENHGAAGLGVPIGLTAVAAAETLAIMAVTSRFGAAWGALAIVHLMALGAVAVLFAVTWRSGRDTTAPLLGLIAGAAIGPVGMLGAAILGFTASTPAAPSTLIAEWYERIALSTAVDPETRLCDDVGVGRTLDLGATTPEPFPTVMEGGPLAARQTVLGLIARQFHPRYLETLKIALKSPEPSIRVQAAAVATHIGPELRRRFEERTATIDQVGRDPIAALGLLGELEAFIASGLLDAAERQRGVDLAAFLGDCVLEGLAPRPLDLPYATDPIRAAELEGPLEDLLLSRRRFAEFRTQRSARRIQARHPTARTKRLASARRPTPVIA